MFRQQFEASDLAVLLLPVGILVVLLVLSAALGLPSGAG